MSSATPSHAHTGTADPIRAVSVISTGSVEIHPEHALATRKPLYWWLLTSRRWLPPRPINVYVIEHAKGLLLFDTGQDRASVTDDSYFPGGFPGIVYDRLARFHISEDETLDAQLATLGYSPLTSIPRSCPTCTRTHRRDPGWATRPTDRGRGMGAALRVLPEVRGFLRPAHRHSRREVDARQLPPNQRCRTGTVHRIARRHG